MATARLENVSKRYPDHLAVNGINLDVHEGEFMVLVGPSGCGKSTTLRMIAGLENATEGDIWIGDRLVNRVSPRDRDVAMVFQSYALYPNMNVHRNLSYSLRLRRTPKDEIDIRVRKVADSLDLARLLHRKPGQLSGGQRQRVALGRAIIREPELFLMDEPLSNLDAKLRVQTRSEITRLQREFGVTTIYVTHDQTEAMTMGSRIVVMNDGRIQQIDTPRELYRHPANAFVAQFIGTPPMNLIECRLECSGTAKALQGDGANVECPDAAADALAPESGGFLVGFRPEDAVVGGGPGDGFFGTTVAIEDLGHESLVAVADGGSKFIVRLAPTAADRIRLGDRMAFSVDPSMLRFFSRSSGNAISVPSGAVRRQNRQEQPT